MAEKVRSVLNDYPKLKLTQGRKVLEIRPNIKWDKGKALEFLLRSLGYAKSQDVFPIYIGDDRTDEDAFKVTNFYECSIIYTLDMFLLFLMIFLSLWIIIFRFYAIEVKELGF